jgi:hypothetical protein
VGAVRCCGPVCCSCCCCCYYRRCFASACPHPPSCTDLRRAAAIHELSLHHTASGIACATLHAACRRIHLWALILAPSPCIRNPARLPDEPDHEYGTRTPPPRAWKCFPRFQWPMAREQRLPFASSVSGSRIQQLRIYTDAYGAHVRRLDHATSENHPSTASAAHYANMAEHVDQSVHVCTIVVPISPRTWSCASRVNAAIRSPCNWS